MYPMREKGRNFYGLHRSIQGSHHIPHCILSTFSAKSSYLYKTSLVLIPIHDPDHLAPAVIVVTLQSPAFLPVPGHPPLSGAGRPHSRHSRNHQSSLKASSYSHNTPIFILCHIINICLIINTYLDIF